MSDSLVELLHRQVRQRPQAEALVQGARRVSYAALWQAVGAVAAALRDAGLQPGERVCLLAEASPEYVAGYYGTLAAGGVVVPLNTAARAHDLLNWAAHSGARVLLHGPHPALSEVVPALPAGCAALALGASALRDDAAAAAVDPAPVQPEALASIIYTSGTTGRPKGVMLSHRNLVSNMLAVVEYLQLTADDRVLHGLPMHYSYGNSVLHTHLAVGAAVVIENGFVYPQRVLERMAAERVTGFSGVPASYRLLLTRARPEHHRLEALRYLTQAGGAMAPADILRVRAVWPQARFYVMYGQTEATARLTYLPPEALPAKLGSVGLPIAGTEIAVLDADGRPLPPGSAGEICARGPGVMLGYWRDSEATRQTLRGGWLWTGDLGRLDEHGYLYIQGRLGELIKTGAHRVSPAEVEEAVLELDGVVEAAAAGVPDPLLGQVIKVWLVRRPDAPLDARTVLAHCHRRLPTYKVPKQIAFVDALPKTASGKVKRFELSAMEAVG